MRSAPTSNWLFQQDPLSSSSSTSTINLILTWRQNMPVIALLDIIIKTIPSLPFSSLFWCQSRPGLTSWMFMSSFLCFLHHIFNSYQYVLSRTMYQIPPCNNIKGLLNLTPFTCNTIQALLPVTKVQSQFTTLYDPLLNLWGTMRVFSESLKLWVTLNDVWFSIPPP